MSFTGSKVYFSWAGNKERVDNLPENLQLLGEVPQAHKLLRDVHLNVLLSDFGRLAYFYNRSSLLWSSSASLNVGGIMRF